MSTDDKPQDDAQPQPLVYVDELLVYPNAWGPFAKGSCHMFAKLEHTEALHTLATMIGLRRSWFQGDKDGGHYDLTPGKRAAALRAGAVPLPRAEAVAVWRANRAALEAQDPGGRKRALDARRAGRRR